MDLDVPALPEVRDGIVAMLRGLMPPRETPEVLVVPGPGGKPSLSLRIYRPTGGSASRPAIFHIHGGGFVMGTAAMMDGSNERYAADHDAVVISVDYRLAPEAPFPAPIEDCYAGLSWVVAQAQALGIDRSRIVLLGESAGGGLAAALAILMRDRGGPVLRSQFLLYPMLDDRTGAVAGGIDNAMSGAFIWSRASNRFGWASMRGTQPIPVERMAHFAPARLDDFRGLPPAYIAVGALDLFIDEDIAYATHLIRAGVPTEMHVYPGAPHGLDLVPDAAATNRFRRDLADALNRALRRR